MISAEDHSAKTGANRPVKEGIIPGAATYTLQTKPPATYSVVRGDTLYSIAWRYQLDYKKVASWNRIRSPYVIHVGQRLRLTASPGPVQHPTKPVAKSTPVTPKPAVVRAPKPRVETKATPPKVVSKPPPKVTSGPLKWQWPTKGKAGAATSKNRQGIEIKGKMGQTITAASGGEVVYSGSGLVGYGNLIIIKHSQAYLSAYAYNSRLLVGEGTRVAAGQPIAEMGNSGTNSVKLYFEIRKNGKAVNPRQYLP